MLRKLKIKALSVWMILAPVSMPLVLTSCDGEKDNWVYEIIQLLLSMLGYDMSKEQESFNEQDKTYVVDDPDTGKLKSEANLEDYFAPIGDQGSYGTCVAWSSGYALKTSLDAKSKGYTETQLMSPSYQCSPVDLWHEIDRNGKSTNCDGSNFEPALEAMMKNGVASMSQVPFTNKKMVCDNVTAKGGSNKLANYRIIAYSNLLSGNGSQGMTASNIKYYLSNGFPVLIGAKLGDNFMQWSSSAAIKSDVTTYTGEHAYHAMVVVGYDDTRNAFRVRNSWGEKWGDNGSIWVDYNFFFKQFMFGAWVAWNPDQVPPTVSSSSNGTKAGSANNLTAHVYSDVENADGTRTLTYDIENKGNSTITSSKEWSVVYMLFKKKNINERAILFHDIYSDEEDAAENGVAIFSSESVATDVDVKSGESVAKALGGKKMSFTYKLPNSINGKMLNGDYYLVLAVNPFNKFDESDKNDNICFVTSAGATPLTFENGKITNMPKSLTDVRSLANYDKNTYTADEILTMLEFKNKNNRWQEEVMQDGLKSGKAVKKILK